MNLPILTANVLKLVIFAGHTFMGDKDLRVIEPENIDRDFNNKLEKWIHARAHLHIVSMGFLLATIGLTLINFTDWLPDEVLILKILSIYFLACSMGFLISVIISKEFPQKYLKLYQWILLLIISGLIYWGASFTNA